MKKLYLILIFLCVMVQASLAEDYSTLAYPVINYLAASNYFASVVNAANLTVGTFTNRASAGGKLQITDANGKIIDATVGAGLLLSGGTLSTNGQTTGGGGTDSGAWRTNGNQAPNGAQLGILGFTNGNKMEMRMDVNGVDGSTVLKFDTVANNNTVNIAMGSSVGYGSANFCASVFGGENNSTANGLTDPTIIGGRFNTIGANGNQAIVLGGGTNNALNGFSLAAGQAATAANNNAFVWNGIANKPITTSGTAADEGKVLFGVGVGGFEVTNSGSYRLLISADGMGFNGNSGVINFTNGGGRYSRVGPFTGTGSGVTIYGTNTGSANALTSLLDITGNGILASVGISVTGNTNSSLTASRMVMSDANKALSSSAASGAVPIDADGSATTAAQINALNVGSILTNVLTSQSANYNILNTDSIVLLNGNLTATLPTAVGIPGKSFTIVCKTAGTNAILSTSAQTFLGYGSTAATKWTNSVVGRSTTVISDGANWVVLKSDN